MPCPLGDGDVRGCRLAKPLPSEIPEGFENLLFTRNALKRNCAYSIVVGMEPTGHYFKPLAYFLANTGCGGVGKSVPCKSQQNLMITVLPKMTKNGRHSQAVSQGNYSLPH